MAKYSTIKDIKDDFISKFTKESDHQEAEEYVSKVLSKMGKDWRNEPITQIMKDLSVCYATYKRAFYESNTKDDIFYQKYISYEKVLRDLTADLIRSMPSDNSRIFSDTFREQHPNCKDREAFKWDELKGEVK